MIKKTIPFSIALLLIFNTTFGVALIQHYFYKAEITKLLSYKTELENTPEKRAERLKSKVISQGGVNIGIRWEDLGEKLLETGVINEEKFLSLYKFAGERKEYKDLLSGNSNEYIILDENNSRFVLNTLWALGLVQTSNALTNMQNGYDQVENLAATGGWSLGMGDAMKYYNSENLLGLSDEQQKLVTNITENIYRPCCNNPTAFADCNHGMAMLGLVELMVANGFEENEIYETALKVNSVWFTDTYMTLADYFESEEGIEWKDVNPKLALGIDFSSGTGASNIQSQVQPISGSGGGGCGV